MKRRRRGEEEEEKEEEEEEEKEEEEEAEKEGEKEEKEEERSNSSKYVSLHIRVLSPQTKPYDNPETSIIFCALLSNRDFSTLVEPLFQIPPD